MVELIRKTKRKESAGMDEKEADKIKNQHMAEKPFNDLMQGTIPDTKISLDSEAAKTIAETATSLKNTGDTVGKAVRLTKKKVDGILSGSSFVKEIGPYQDLLIAIGVYLRMIYNVTKAIRDNKRWRSRRSWW